MHTLSLVLDKKFPCCGTYKIGNIHIYVPIDNIEEVFHSISNLYVIINNCKTDSKTWGQESEESKHNLFVTFISLLCFYVMFFFISMN